MKLNRIAQWRSFKSEPKDARTRKNKNAAAGAEINDQASHLQFKGSATLISIPFFPSIFQWHKESRREWERGRRNTDIPTELDYDISILLRRKNGKKANVCVCLVRSFEKSFPVK